MPTLICKPVLCGRMRPRLFFVDLYAFSLFINNVLNQIQSHAVCQNAMQRSLRSILQGSVRWSPFLSIIFQRVFVLYAIPFCLLMILNDC